MYLAAAGVGTIGVVDDDVVDASNLQRQVVHGVADVGRPKTESAAETVAASLRLLSEVLAEVLSEVASEAVSEVEGSHVVGSSEHCTGLMVALRSPVASGSSGRAATRSRPRSACRGRAGRP